MKKLRKELPFKPLWTSYMACLKSMGDYLGLEHSLPWIFGATGHAFIMNIHPQLCPSGPTAFSQNPLNELAASLGFDLNGSVFDKNDKEFVTKRKETWESTKLAIDNDMPTLGWEMNIPEYYMIYGYDKENYLFRDFDGQALKRKWDTLADTEIGVVCMYSANPNGKKASVNQVLKDTFSFALQFAKKNREWTYPQFYNGTRAYDCWMESMQQNKFLPFGLAYNAQVWSECRTMAVEFLKEAKVKLKSKFLDNLIEHYDVVSWSLQKVAKLLPLDIEEIGRDETDSAIESLFLAREAEKAALSEMKQLLSKL